MSPVVLTVKRFYLWPQQVRPLPDGPSPILSTIRHITRLQLSSGSNRSLALVPRSNSYMANPWSLVSGRRGCLIMINAVDGRYMCT